MDIRAKTIAKITNTPSGNDLEIYERMPQPHLFTNLLYGSAQLPHHIMTGRLNSSDLSTYHGKFNQVVSWDSAIIFMNRDARRSFWASIERCMVPGGRITVVWNHFLHVSEAAALFMNRGEFREMNHHFRANFRPSDFEGASRIWDEIRESDGYRQFRDIAEKDLIRNADVMCIPYFDLIDPNCFLDADEAQHCLEGVCLSAIGIDIALEA